MAYLFCNVSCIIGKLGVELVYELIRVPPRARHVTLNGGYTLWLGATPSSALRGLMRSMPGPIWTFQCHGAVCSNLCVLGWAVTDYPVIITGTQRPIGT